MTIRVEEEASARSPDPPGLAYSELAHRRTATLEIQPGLREADESDVLELVSR